MLLLKIAVKASGKPVPFAKLRLEMPEDAFVANLKLVQAMHLLDFRATPAGYLFDLRPLWRALDAHAAGHRIIPFSTVRFDEITNLSDAWHALEHVLRLLGEAARSNTSRPKRDEWEGWQSLGGKALDFLLRTAKEER